MPSDPVVTVLAFSELYQGTLGCAKLRQMQTQRCASALDIRSVDIKDTAADLRRRIIVFLVRDKVERSTSDAASQSSKAQFRIDVDTKPLMPLHWVDVTGDHNRHESAVVRVFHLSSEPGEEALDHLSA
jgi:hypothetical protein